MQSRNIFPKQPGYGAGTTSFEVLVTGATLTISKNEIQGFVADLKELFHKPSIEAYETKLQQLSISWSNPVSQYHMKNIHPEVYTSIGRWILEAEGVYSPFSGVVTNQSESFNMVLKSLQQWKEVPVDCIVLSFYLLQSFFMNEITRGLAGQGSYHLHQQFLPLMEEAEVSDPAFICVHPHEIVSRIREKDDITTTADGNGSSPPQEEEVQPEVHKPPSALSQLERAQIILQSGKISFNPKLHLFNVLGSGDRPYVVHGGETGSPAQSDITSKEDPESQGQNIWKEEATQGRY